jgi:hypothetical protein
VLRETSHATSPRWDVQEPHGGPVKPFWLVVDGPVTKDLARRLVEEPWTVLVVHWGNRWTTVATSGLLLEPVEGRGPDAFARVGVFSASWSKSQRAFATQGAHAGANRIRVGSRIYDRKTIRLF